MEITKDIIRSISSYMLKSGLNQSELGEKVGVSQATIGRWLMVDGGSKDIRNSHWIKLEPLIREFLPNPVNGAVADAYGDLQIEAKYEYGDINITPILVEKFKLETQLDLELKKLKSLQDQGKIEDAGYLEQAIEHYRKELVKIEAKLESMKIKLISSEQVINDVKAAGLEIVETRRTRVPVISFAQASGFDPMLEPMEELWHDPIDHANFQTEIKDGMFAIKIEGESMEPMIPAGSYALVDSRQLPKTGKPCIAKLSDTGQVICKIWYWKNSEIKLTSINPEGENFGPWTRQEAHGNLLFRFPIIELNIKY